MYFLPGVLDVLEVVIVFGNVKSRSPFVVDMNSDDLDAKSKLKLSSFKRSEFSNSLGASISDASKVSLALDDFGDEHEEIFVGITLLFSLL